jgi:hypothetical protein
MLEGKHMTVASAGKQRQTIRPCSSDHDQRLRVRCRKFLLSSMLAHFMRLMGTNAQRCPGFSCAQENESSLAILGVVAYGIGLIDFPWTLEAGRRK